MTTRSGTRTTRTSPLAWWSVGLGAFSLLPFIWIYFVPALCGLTTGVLAARQISMRPGRFHGRGLASLGMALSAISLVSGVGVLVMVISGRWQWPGS